MSIADWNESFETGIEEIDAQHKHLFEVINRLAACFKAGRAETGARERSGGADEANACPSC